MHVCICNSPFHAEWEKAAKKGTARANKRNDQLSVLSHMTSIEDTNLPYYLSSFSTNTVKHIHNISSLCMYENIVEERICILVALYSALVRLESSARKLKGKSQKKIYFSLYIYVFIYLSL